MQSRQWHRGAIFLTLHACKVFYGSWDMLCAVVILLHKLILKNRVAYRINKNGLVTTPKFTRW